MMTCFFRKSVLLCLVVGVTLSGCKKSRPEPDYRDLKVHTLVFGGDLFLSGCVNQVAYDPALWPSLLGNTAPLFKRADIALVNAEGVISGGGEMSEKNDTYPLFFRAHPNAAKMLADVGVDVVAVGNNHSGDFGPQAFVEMLDLLGQSGIDYTGGGHTIRDAETPPILVAEETGVAIVGADLTYNRHGAAGLDRPGSLFFGVAHRGQNLGDTVAALKRILGKARQQANLVLLTPHWGDNWKKAPTPSLEKLAHQLIDVGFDGILGHSAHLVQGVELIDGKPVIYDTGNLVLNYGPPNDHDEHLALLYEIRFNKAGITRLVGHPLFVDRCRTRLAEGAMRDEVLKNFKVQSDDMGTEVRLENGTAVIDCKPGKLEGPKQPTARRRGRAGPVREAPSHLILDSLPDYATPANVVFANGIRLVGFRMLSPRLSENRSAALIETFWIADTPKERNLLIHMEARGQDRRSGEPKTLFAGHEAGDWVLPISKWPVGKIIRDITYFFVSFKIDAPIRFYTGLWRETFTEVSAADLPIEEKHRVFLGEARHEKGGPDAKTLLKKLKTDLVGKK